MIDIEKEALILWNKIPNHLPKTNGKKMNLATTYRWRNQGLHGVRLEVCYIGGKPHTSKEALVRFDKAVTEAKINPPPKPTKPSKAKSTKAHERALKQLKK